jgi:hypothetical protein
VIAYIHNENQPNHLYRKHTVESYTEALKIESQAVMAMVNSSIAYAKMGENEKADKSLQAGLKKGGRRYLAAGEMAEKDQW